MEIQAAVLRQPGRPFTVETLELAEPRAGEVLLRMAAAGVCHSDWHLMTGASRHRLPVVPGHEGAGVVLRVGEGVDDLRPGDAVIINWAPACGACFYCGQGQSYLCAAYVEPIWAGVQLDGTSRLSQNGKTIYQFHAVACFADHMVVPRLSCVKIQHDAVPFSVAALIGCAATTGVGAVLNTAQVEPGSSVAVFGVGGVGSSIILAARLAGAAKIIAIDRTAEQCERAQRLGATDACLADESPVRRIRELTEGHGADYAFEAVGVPTVQEQCFKATRPGGAVVLVGLSPMGSGTNFPAAAMVRQEKRILGSYYGSADGRTEFLRLIDLHRTGRLDLTSLVSRTYRLAEINDAYADMLAGRNVRGVIQFA